MQVCHNRFWHAGTASIWENTFAQMALLKNAGDAIVSIFEGKHPKRSILRKKLKDALSIGRQGIAKLDLAQRWSLAFTFFKMIKHSNIYDFSHTDKRKQIDGLAALVQTRLVSKWMIRRSACFAEGGQTASRHSIGTAWDISCSNNRLTEKQSQWPRNEAALKKLTL